MISKVELDNLLSLDFYKLKRMNGDETNGEDISLQKGDEKAIGRFRRGLTGIVTGKQIGRAHV